MESILYLHGGGYTCGGLDYALGFGSTLADESGAKVFCAAYRLAPEAPFPAAVEDALESYRYLLDKGYAPKKICLCGESAGGGLCFSLCLRLKELGLPLPGSVIAISPWTDLTLSGESFRTNLERDVSLSQEQLAFYTRCYTQEPQTPLASPLFGDLTGLPPSLTLRRRGRAAAQRLPADIPGPPLRRKQQPARSFTRSGGTPICSTALRRTGRTGKPLTPSSPGT